MAVPPANPASIFPPPDCTMTNGIRYVAPEMLPELERELFDKDHVVVLINGGVGPNGEKFCMFYSVSPGYVVKGVHALSGVSMFNLASTGKPAAAPANAKKK